MNKTDPPKVLGVFKPVGHTVIAFRSDADMQAAVTALVEQGFVESALVRYAPAEMQAQVDAELQAASPLASFGYELDLVKAHGVLAQSGCSFLVVHAPDDAQAERVAAVARATKAVAGQHYGTFMIEELTELAPGGAPAL
ncbi:hypothetical protein [Rhodoferax sp. UBA5149]|uniref:hypothetical protein n=1 Tax=Rhodoferax sp. UBA5149 TaxID=1947379 RepID=UPI0025FB2516|nr:hypothetical protein [Rhodoferax sp. UBA5149]